MPTFFTETTRSMRSVRSSTRTTCSSSTELFPSSPCCIQNGKENMQMLCTHKICCRCRSNRQRHGVRSSVRRKPEVSLWSRWCCAGAAGSECLASNLRQPGCPARCLSHPVGEELGGTTKKQTNTWLQLFQTIVLLVEVISGPVVLLNTKVHMCMLLFRGAKWELPFICFCCDRVVKKILKTCDLSWYWCNS